MTTTARPTADPVTGSSTEAPARITTSPATVAALQEVVYGQYLALHRQIRDLVVGLGDVPRSGLTYTQQTQIAPDLLRAFISLFGVPARVIAADPQLRGALCDAAQVHASRLLLILTGHLDLSIGAILKLGNGSRYQQRLLAELDTGESIGLIAITELGGTNGANQQFIAEWDASADGYWLYSPIDEAEKFMPNAANTSTPKIAVVTARLLVDGVDQGVLPFLLRLRDSTGKLAAGVHVAALSDKNGAPMDHGLIAFERTWVPREALLGGDWAHMTEDGQFECAVPVRDRFHRAISVLDDGRVDLANAAIWSAAAALAGFDNYARQRAPKGSKRLADRDSVQQDQASGVAAVYATRALGRQLRDMRANPAATDHDHGTLAMLAKPLLSYTARRVLMTMREHAAAQGALRINHITDWLDNLEAIITAEGTNRALWATAGRSPKIADIQLPGTPAQLPWWARMLVEREHRIATALRNGTYDPASSALGPESAAVELATATSQRLATTSLLGIADVTTDPDARRLATSAAAAYALEIIDDGAKWFINHPDVPKVAAALRHHRSILVENLALMVDAFDITGLKGPIFAENYIKATKDSIAPGRNTA
ncbi:acyl-CoA dehydrogenase family protein [Nocardia pseudovaccinii]|uniref:acyl-CoA dehydrogenase family protein n=1 Tax=Nocardia pseudovaccinii TaxID=189540 RepID=UPI000A047BBB|nr:acyl-CoA dehydrogenase family protein [Nocardia pseudovaccinii]